MASKASWGYSVDFMEACREELTVHPNRLESASFSYWVAETLSGILGFYALEKQSSTVFELEALFVAPIR